VLEVRAALARLELMLNLAIDSDYSDRLELKSSMDRTLGVGASLSDPTIIIMTAATVMKAVVDIDAILGFDQR
jgi:nuclear pore complex protein Nup133